MDKFSKLEEFNQQIFESLIAHNNHIQLGFFNSDMVLFIGQNPGRPFTQTQIEDIASLKEFTTYREHETAYTEGWKRSIFGDFIGRIINYKWNQISFTNAIKIPTSENALPGLELTEDFVPILEHQVYLLQPKLIVCLGKFVGQLFHMEKFYEFEQGTYGGVVMFPHPSYIQRQGWTQIEEEVRKQRNLLNGYLTTH
jgi:uracil-DNA glycosylase